MVILQTAKHHQSATEWNIHVIEARNADLEEDIIQCIEASDELVSPPKEAALFKFTDELLKTSRVCDGTYWNMQKEFSDRHIVEAVGIVGYYSFVAHTLNVFEI